MSDFFKNLWILFFVLMILAILMGTPIERSQHEYYSEINKIKSTPQRRVDATAKYVEAIDEGTEDLSQGLNMIPPRKYYVDSEDEEYYKIIPNSHAHNQTSIQYEQRKIKPKYKRDKNNPKILYPYPRY